MLIPVLCDLCFTAPCSTMNPGYPGRAGESSTILALYCTMKPYINRPCVGVRLGFRVSDVLHHGGGMHADVLYLLAHLPV